MIVEAIRRRLRLLEPDDVLCMGKLGRGDEGALFEPRLFSRSLGADRSRVIVGKEDLRILEGFSDGEGIIASSTLRWLRRADEVDEVAGAEASTSN